MRSNWHAHLSEILQGLSLSYPPDTDEQILTALYHIARRARAPKDDQERKLLDKYEGRTGEQIEKLCVHFQVDRPSEQSIPGYRDFLRRCLGQVKAAPWQKRIQYWQEVLDRFDLADMAKDKPLPVSRFDLGKDAGSSAPPRPAPGKIEVPRNYKAGDCGWWLLVYAENPQQREAKVFLGIPLAYDESTQAFAPPRNARPRIERNWMEPANPYKPQNGYLCHVDAYARWFAEHPYPLPDEEEMDWCAYWRYCQDMTHALTGKPMERIHHAAGEDWAELGWKIVPAQAHAVHRHIQALEAAIRGEAPMLRYCASPEVPHPTLSPLDLGDARHRHLAHMDANETRTGGRKGFSLEFSQRQAVQHLQLVPESGVLAVNGPPGTGKTSFLRSVIATLWVDAAVAGADCPIILATASTNKAVTNIIQSFSEIPGPALEPDWASRWLPGLPSYGWFHPAKTRGRDYWERYMALRSNDRNSPLAGDGEALTFFQEAHTGTDAMKIRFLELHARCVDLPQPLSNIQAAIADLRGRLSASVATMRGIQERISALIQTRLQHNDLWSREAQYLQQQSGIREKFGELAKRERELSGRIDQVQQERALLLGSWQHYVEENRAAERQKAAISIVRQIEDLLREMEIATKAPSSRAGWLGLFLKRPTAEARQTEQRLADLRRRLREIGSMSVPNPSPPADLAGIDQRLVTLQTQMADLQREKTRFADEYRRLREALAPCAAFRRQLQAEKTDLTGKLAEAGDLSAFFERLEALDDPDVAESVYADLLCLQEEILDRRFRFQHFHMAARYWEARWLETPLATATTSVEAEQAHLRHLAMLAPVIVATVHTLPAIRGNGPYAFADLLIFDEAGQTTPELGMAVFALARRAIVVGDIFQLEPIWSMAEADEKFLLDGLGIDESGGSPQGPGMAPAYSSCTGSVMRIAQAASYFGPADGTPQHPGGISLSAHYRCRETIIRYCKELIYGEELRPMRDDGSSLCPYPPMTWVAVEGSRAERQQSSWVNEAEVQEIVGWLADEKDRLLDQFQTGNLADIVAVIAPFRAQAERIRKRIAEHPNLGVKLAKDMIVNTVHALQGAEIPVVAFSVTQTDPPFFANGGDPIKPNLLNVAISRAQEAFVLFAGPRVLEQPGPREEPLGLLVDYLRRKGQRLYPRELLIVESPQKIQHLRQALGRSAKILATSGHFLEIAAWPKGQPPEWASCGSSFLDDLAQELEHGAGQFDHMVLATDDDRDGEEIAWHVLRAVRGQTPRLVERALRMRFHALEPHTLRQARKEARPGIDLRRVQASLLKRLADYRYVEKVNAKTGQHIGRNQMATLGYLAQAANLPPERFRVYVEGEYQGQTLRAYYVRNRAATAPTPWLTLEDMLPLNLRVVTRLSSLECVGMRSVERDYPRFPAQTTARFYLSGWRRYGWRPQESAQHLQNLYLGRFQTVVRQDGAGDAE